MSLPDDMYSHYGFNFSTLICNSWNLDLIKGVFGLEEETIVNTEPEKAAIAWPKETIDTPRSEVQATLKEHEFRDTILWRSSSPEAETETDTESETTASEQEISIPAGRPVGVCVDCSCCLRFCECAKTSMPKAPVRTICNPATCKHVVCSDCTFCTDHCTCRCEV